jgi:hypothetical protein
LSDSPPGSPRRRIKITERLFTRRIGCLLLLLLVVITVGFAFYWDKVDWAKVAAWCKANADYASVLGLLVSVVGFALTILTMLETQQISREAQERIEQAAQGAEEAVRRAEGETQRMVDGIATQLRSADFAALGSWLRDLRQAAFDTQWHRAVYRAQECQWLATRLAQDNRLVQNETTELNNGTTHLYEVQRFIENNRMGGQEGGLTRAHIEAIDTLIQLLRRIEGRLLQQAMGGSI